ncbi:MAG TPA: hypothetical protein VLG11_00610 [Candidatus Saccharimonadales bacterium]|nr:hypothetical protein [Candidatus Saccharimonadales bacterium]
MAKKTTKQVSDKAKTALCCLAAVLAAIVISVALTLKAHDTGANKINVSLGGFGYNITNGQAVPRTDSAATGLKDFLTMLAQKDVQSGCKSASYYVAAYSQNQQQVRLQYHCGTAPDSPMYAVKDAGLWKAIQPTGQFDAFGIPECSYVTHNSIDTKIAPVCADGGTNASPQYRVR